MSCEVLTASKNLPPNGCSIVNRNWPTRCLTEFAGGRQEIAAGASYVYKFALDIAGMVVSDIVVDGGSDTDGLSELYVTAIEFDSNPIWPKTISAVTANVNAVQEVPLTALLREVVYWYGGGPMGTGTPFAAILRALGALPRDKGLFITVENKGAGTQVVPGLSLVMAVDPSASPDDT